MGTLDWNHSVHLLSAVADYSDFHRIIDYYYYCDIDLSMSPSAEAIYDGGMMRICDYCIVSDWAGDFGGDDDSLVVCSP